MALRCASLMLYPITRYHFYDTYARSQNDLERHDPRDRGVIFWLHR